jgi:hypothetical protein
VRRPPRFRRRSGVTYRPGSTRRAALRCAALRVAVGEVDVLAHVTMDVYDGANWGGSDPEVVDRVACLLGLISRSATCAVTAFHRLHTAVADAQPASAGERWDDAGASTPG